jgi:CDP-archaeol synthase
LRCARLNVAKVNSERSKGRAKILVNVLKGAKVTVSRLVELVYLMLPAYAANMAPPFVKFWPGWNRPINRALLGDHKTVVGFALGVLVGIFAAYIQSLIDWSRSPLPSGSFSARAMLLGEHIDLRSRFAGEVLARNPLTVPVKGGGVAVLFRYGAVVQ